MEKHEEDRREKGESVDDQSSKARSCAVERKVRKKGKKGKRMEREEYRTCYKSERPRQSKCESKGSQSLGKLSMKGRISNEGAYPR